MTILFTHTIAGEPYVLTLPAGPPAGGITTGPSNPTPPAITGIKQNQYQALPAGLTQQGGNNKFICATFDPIGGTGPFQYELDTIDSNGFGAIGTDGSIFDGVTNRGWIVIQNNVGSPTSKTLKITDGTGTPFTSPITFVMTGGAGIYVAGPRTWATNVNPYTLTMLVNLWNGTALDTTTVATVTDPSSYFVFAYGSVGLASPTNFPPPGSYPITVGAPGYAPISVTIVIVAAVAGTPYFVQTLASISTSVLPGTVVGKIIGTTPNNTFALSINDTSGTLGINGTNIVIQNQPTSAGALSFSFTITDQGQNTTVSCSSSSSATLTIAAGTTLPAGNMSFAGLTTAFTNDTWGNSIGTPTVTGITGTKQWTIVSQTGFNPLAVNSAFGSSPARYQIDASAGTITAPGPLSAGLPSYNPSTFAVTLPSATDTLMVSCTDGINTCTAPLNIGVNWGAVVNFYVGQGASTTYGANGFEHLETYRATWSTSDNAPHTGTHIVHVAANASLDYYTNDTGITDSNYAARFPYAGPVVVVGVAGNGFSQPRLGGPSANNVGGGGDMRGKGFMVFGNGDGAAFNLEISGCHDAASDGLHGVEAIRKDGETYGNLTVAHNYIHDNDNGFLTGVCHGTLLAEYNLIENGGTAYVSGGATHNAYIGEMGTAIFRYNVSRRANNGYLLKCRAQVSQIYGNRFLDGLSGSASACLDLPYAGQATVYNNYFEKGPMALGPDTIRYGEEGIVWTTNTLSVHDNVIAVLTLPGGHYGGPSLIGWFGGVNASGVAATGTLTNNSIYMVAGGTKVLAYNGASAASVVETGTAILASPTAISVTRPDLGTTEPDSGPLYRHLSYGQDSFINFDDGYHYQDRDQIQIATTATTGTTICTIHAVNQLSDQGAGTANPFVAGTVWALVGDATPYGGFTGWATAKYVLITNSDGSATIQVGHAPLTVGVDYLQVRATAPNGKISDSRYAIAVSAGTGIADNTPATYATLF